MYNIHTYVSYTCVYRTHTYSWFCGPFVASSSGRARQTDSELDAQIKASKPVRGVTYIVHSECDE
jgi:hypothetical protein